MEPTTRARPHVAVDHVHFSSLHRMHRRAISQGMHERSKEKEMDRLRKLAEMLRAANEAATRGEAKPEKPAPKMKKLRRGDGKRG
jgi:hypothetical protein